MPAPALAVVFLVTDIEGSTRLWEQQPALMRRALAAHDSIARQVLARHRGTLVKATGDGIHAAFDDALDALDAMLALQRALADPQATVGLPLALRCGLHRGADEARDHDYFGPDVNRAARIMAAAHGGQMLMSQVVEHGGGYRPAMAMMAGITFIGGLLMLLLLRLPFLDAVPTFGAAPGAVATGAPVHRPSTLLNEPHSP